MSRIRKNSSDLLREIKKGLVLAKPYLLSHQPKGDWNKCVIIANQRVCSRCLGIYGGILSGAILFLSHVTSENHLLLTVILPIPMLVDWYLTEKKIVQSSNSQRIGTGFLFGVGYVTGLLALLTQFELGTVVIAGGYSLLVSYLLMKKHLK